MTENQAIAAAQTLASQHCVRVPVVSDPNNPAECVAVIDDLDGQYVGWQVIAVASPDGFVER